jgi:DNA-binding GntR family transcriptional regulator
MQEPFSAITPKSITDMVFEALRHRIVDGQLPPGMRLVESEIAQQMQVSRAPVREANRRLQQEGLVVCRPRRVPTVVDILPGDTRSLLSAGFLIERPIGRDLNDACVPGVFEGSGSQRARKTAR